jgi:hypothetical protein
MPPEQTAKLAALIAQFRTSVARERAFERALLRALANPAVRAAVHGIVGDEIKRPLALSEARE